MFEGVKMAEGQSGGGKKNLLTWSSKKFQDVKWETGGDGREFW